LTSRSSRLAQVFNSASFPDGKTSLTSFSKRSWIVSLSLTYPASGWVFLLFHNVKERSPFILLVQGLGIEPSAHLRYHLALFFQPTTARQRSCSISPLANIR
jgi:hypothetical protein